jgi:predicted dehydrogenase
MARFLANLQGQPLQGCVTLSKTHTLSNRLCITGEYGTLEIGEGQAHSVTYWPAQNRLRHEITCAGMNKDIEPNYFERQLDNFVHAIRTGTSPKVDGEQGAKSVAIMERCYNIATPIDEPWCHATLECLKAAMPPLTAGEVPLPLSLSRRG